MTTDIRDQAKRIAERTLVIGCTQDHMVRVAHARDLAAVIPGARYVGIVTGHLAALEKPEEVARLSALGSLDLRPDHWFAWVGARACSPAV